MDSAESEQRPRNSVANPGILELFSRAPRAKWPARSPVLLYPETARRASRRRGPIGAPKRATRSERELDEGDHEMKTQDLVSDFKSTDQNGKAVRLSGLLENGPLALFFYPKAMTPG